MLMRSHSERRALLGFSALLTQSTPQKQDHASPLLSSFTSRESIFSPEPLTAPPPWVTQALTNLEQGEKELQSLRERQQAEVEEVNRELDNAVIGAQREERRLLEKVDKDHREAQRQMSQLKRENSAAVRVVQSLVDQQLRKIGQLKEQILRWGASAAGANKYQLQRGVAEVTQPWEISLTMKRVHFLPSPQSNTFCLGEVEVQEQGMTYPIGVCGVQGQKCALHSGDKAFLNRTPLEIRKDPAPNKTSPRHSPDEGMRAVSGNTRVIRKLRLSSPTENEEDAKVPISPAARQRRVSESSQDEEVESECSDTIGQDMFLAMPPVSSQGESEGDESDGKQCVAKKRLILKGKKNSQALASEKQCKDEAKNRRKGSFIRGSLVDLSPNRQLSLSKKKCGSSEDSGSPPSPVDSEDSCYTDRVTSPAQMDSTADLPTKMQPLTQSDGPECKVERKISRMQIAMEPSMPDQCQRREIEQSRSQTPVIMDLGSHRVSRSMSMSAIEGDIKGSEQDQDRKVDAESKGHSEEGGSGALDSASLVKQIGKQGTGRTDFNLPSGVHATIKGQLFVVDCGNARVQVTDLQKNVVQQVSPSGSERSSRICNYFDVAVNSKGLIALTCAAERALLVFSRHGRLLQTFGGTAIGSTNEELDAPRGVTVTREDEFLVADIKRGTLTSLKLDHKTGARVERTVVSGYHRPYLVAACLNTGLMAVSERGNETGRVPCIRVLEPGWTTIRILGVCSGLGPVLSCPWGLCIDSDGDVLVADWGKQHHRILIYPETGVGWPIVNDNLSSPRGLALLPEGHMAVSDSMNHSIKIYRYK
ncbi:uncharacterized protein ACB058_004404 [Synchiropus picturatus]